MLRFLLIATVKHLVNVAMGGDSVGRSVSPTKPGLAATPNGAAALIYARPTTVRGGRGLPTGLQRKHYIFHLFYVEFSSCPNR